ncbi:MAG: hypothetical protein ACO29Q_08115 [Crocinitomicaceae bacterium]
MTTNIYTYPIMPKQDEQFNLFDPDTGATMQVSIQEQIDLKIEWCEKILNGGKALSADFRARYQKD